MLELRKITKSYRTKDYVQNALNEVSIGFRKNEFASILGASGSGKTTMLNIIGGLDQYDQGNLLIDGVSTRQYKSSDWDTYRNNRVGFVFQSYNLIPHQTILANVELALTLSGVSAKERKNRAIDALDDVGLIDHISKLPNQLSGGQMQRVAIARALINDPEIVLADEPTGALDSTTSDQVMKLLEDIAKDRLVIMVTHNPELAHRYTNRIIKLKDGEVISDSNPYTLDAKETDLEEVKSKKTKMSFLTAISLSISNLMTKKGRTLITSVAGSIGIIGIAAILALASGINLYIKGIEQETMSAYPLTVDSSGIDIGSFMGGEGNDLVNKDKVEVKENESAVINTITSLFSHQNKNDLKSFRTYLDQNSSKINPYVKNIQYKYGITPLIFLENEKVSVRQVNPDTIFSKYGFDDSSNNLDMISGAGDMGMKNFNELPGDASLFKEQYDVISGRWPKDKNELVVVLMNSGSLTDMTMYTLGLKDRKQLDNMFDDFINDQNLEIEANKKEKINHKEIIGKKFKLINPSEKYVYDKNYKIWVDKSDDVKFMDQVIAKGTDLEVVGIVKANPETKTPMLSTGIYYPNDLTTHLINEASTFDIVKEQIKNKDINVFTGKAFDSEEELAAGDLFKIEDFITIDQKKIEEAFTFDMSSMNIDFSDIEISTDQIDLPDLNLEGLASTIASQINVPIEDVQKILTGVLQDFIASQDEDFENLEDLVSKFDEYINSEAVQNKLISDFSKLNDEQEITSKLSEIVQNYFDDYVKLSFQKIMMTVQNDLVIQVGDKINDMASNMENALSIDTEIMSQAFQFNIDEEEFFSLIRSLGERSQVSQASNLSTLGYKDLNEPSQINLYPKDFTTKEDVIDFITSYNDEMLVLDQEDKVVKYTDFVGAIMSSVTTIINTISYALIAFVAISLVVSSIMIGVITYVSVLERIKEIGILRAIGASKKDIRRVFNAETLIVGFIAGTIGVLITYAISFFANIIVYDKFGIANIASLEIKAAVILVLISMFLAFISGLFPSSTAANKDPVEALRSE